MHWIMYGLYIEIMSDYVKINRRLSFCPFFKQNGPIMLKKVANGVSPPTQNRPPPGQENGPPIKNDPTYIFFCRPF